MVQQVAKINIAFNHLELQMSATLLLMPALQSKEFLQACALNRLQALFLHQLHQIHVLVIIISMVLLLVNQVIVFKCLELLNSVFHMSHHVQTKMDYQHHHAHQHQFLQVQQNHQYYLPQHANVAFI